MAGETAVGGIVGFLRMEADQFHREIQQALLEVESLSGKRVKVDVDSRSLDRVPAAGRSAAAGLDEAARAQRRLEDATKRSNVAQLKLDELNTSGKAKASQKAAAELTLARAQREVLDATSAVSAANLTLDATQDKVVTSTGSAETRTRALTVATRDLEKATKDTDRTTREAHGSANVLVTAIAAVGPALVPVAAGAAGLAAGFGGLGVAGIAAFMGIKNAMGQNNRVGEAYQKAIDSTIGGLEKLEATAAKNVLKPFQDAVGLLNAAMPTLNTQIGDLATVAGKIGGALAGGVITGFQVLNPLIVEASTYMLDLAQRFQSAAGGAGMASFVSYVQSVFPQVMSTIESLVTTVAHLVTAFAPLGGGVLNELKILSTLINAIDPGALAAIATAATSVYIGFQAWKGISGLVDGLASALGGVEGMSQRAATAIRGLEMAAGIIGVAIAALSVLMSQNAESQRQAQQATDDYTEALRRSNGVIDEGVRKTAYDTLLKQGAIDAAKKLGVSLGDVTLAATGNKGAMERVNAVILDAIRNHRDLWGAAHDLRSALGENNGELANAQTAYLDEKEAVGGAATATDDATTTASRHAAVMQDLADKYQWAGSTLDAVQAGEQEMAKQTEIATAKMQDQNDAAGLLKQSLDELNGKAISNEEAQNNYDHATNAVGRPIKQAQDALAAAQKRQAGAAKAVTDAASNQGAVSSKTGHTSPAAAQALETALQKQSQAQEHLSRLQASSKTTAAQLESANNRLANANLAVQHAQENAGKTTGAATAAQKDATAKATEHAKAAKAEADAAVAQAEANLKASKSLVGTSDAAAQNRENIMRMVTEGNKAVGTSQNLAKTNEGARQKLIAVKEQALKTAKGWGLNADEVKKLLDRIDQIPDSVTPTKFQVDTKPAVKATKEWVGVINGVPTWKTVTFDAKTKAALDAVKTVRDAIAGVMDKTVTISAVFAALGPGAAQAAQNAKTLDAHHITNANGSIRLNGVQKMAQGGFAGRESQIMRSTNPILWNEAPGGEAYISLAPEKRARSLAIHSQVGALLGANGGGGSRLHPDDIGMLARALGREIRRMPTPELGLSRLDQALGG